MAYTAWSVVYGEQPTAAKWNQLGTNDAGFKDGTNIDDLAILERHLAADSVTSEKLNPTITTETVSGIVYNVYDYGSHKKYIGELTFSSTSSSTESAGYDYPAGVYPRGATGGTRNAHADFQAISTSGGYPNLHTIAFTTQATSWRWYSGSAAATNGYIRVCFTTF